MAEERNLYVEWSTNEKVAVEVAAAASFAGLRSLCVMKQNGVNVASDFLLHLASSGTRGGMVLVTCDDPGALSSVNEGESRLFARLLEIPLLEPGDFQEAKDIMPFAFQLSEDIRNIVMVRSVTRLSHASGNVRYGSLPDRADRAEFVFHGPLLDPDTGPVISMIVAAPERQHGPQQEKLKKRRNALRRVLSIPTRDRKSRSFSSSRRAPALFTVPKPGGFSTSKTAPVSSKWPPRGPSPRGS